MGLLSIIDRFSRLSGILDRVLEQFGSSESYMEAAFGSETVSGTELRHRMEE